MEISDKDLRNKKILDLHNQGQSVRFIAKELKISVGSVHEVIGTMVSTGKTPSKKVSATAKVDGSEEVITSFSGFELTDVNEYSHKDTGELVRIVFVKAKEGEEFGKFVKLK